MAVDVSRFVTPEQDFAGIYKVTDTLDTQKQRQLAQAEQERKDDEAKRGKTAASMRFFTNYLDPKDRYTGTYYDPKMNEYLGEALSQAYELAGKGAGEAEILTAISPLVNKANDYQQKAKVYSENKKQLLSSLKGQKGYNTEALSNLLDKELFEGADIDKVDPFDLVNPLNRIFEKYGDQITNDEAIDDLVKGLPKSKITTDVVTYNSLGGRQRSKAMVDMPNLFIQEEEDGVSKFVPKYDKATDAGEDIVADFVNEKGQTVKAPVRLLEEGVFNDIINSNPAVKHRVESLVNRAIQSGKYTDETGKPITLDSPQARNLGRALMYDMLKQKARVESNVLQETKPAQVRNITNVSIGGGKEINDVYDIIDKAATEKKKEGKPYLQMNLLPVDAQTLVIDFAKKATNKEYSQKDLKIIKGDDEKLGVYDAKTNLFLGYLRRVGTNLKVQPGVGEKREVVAQGDVEQPKTKMVTVVLGNGRKGQIPSDKVAQFLKDNPGSKRL